MFDHFDLDVREPLGWGESTNEIYSVIYIVSKTLKPHETPLSPIFLKLTLKALKSGVGMIRN